MTHCVQVHGRYIVLSVAIATLTKYILGSSFTRALVWGPLTLGFGGPHVACYTFSSLCVFLPTLPVKENSCEYCAPVAYTHTPRFPVQWLTVNQKSLDLDSMFRVD